LKQPANEGEVSVFILPPYQGCGYDVFFTELCKYWFVYVLSSCIVPLILWHCWLGSRKGIRPEIISHFINPRGFS